MAPGKPRRGDIVLGAGDVRGLTEDGFRLKTRDGRLMISDGGGKGTIYGVVTLLEQYLGVACYGNNAWRLTRSRDVTIPALDHAENPAFRYRQSQCYAMAEPFYRDWFRFEEPSPAATGSTPSTASCRRKSTVGATPNTTPSSTASGVRARRASGV